MGTVPAWTVQVILPVAFFMIGWRHLLNAFLSLLGRPRSPAIEP
jgi:hypothetical protein